MKYLAHTGLALGLILFIALLVWQGIFEVLQLLLSSGWILLTLPLAWLPSLLPATQGWRVLLRDRKPPALHHALAAMWIGRAVNNLLPVATIGGEIAKARLISLWGTRGMDAAASVMVDKVVQALTVALWGLVGVGCLLGLSADRQLALYAMAGFLLFALCIATFFLIQRAGLLGMLAHIGGKLIKTETWAGISLNAREVDAIVIDIYRHRLRLCLAIALRTLGQVLETAEVWLACYLLGFPISLLEAIMLKSLTSTLRDIAFIIPNGYGIQEGAFIVVGSLVGLNAETALAVSLAIRIRDILMDPAGLMALHLIESRRFASRKRQRADGLQDAD